MSSLSIFVFDDAGNLIIRRDLTSGELAAKSATFSLPKSSAGTTCSFYAVAKVAMQTTIDPAFSQKYGGTLTINSVKLSKAASQSLLIAGTPTPGAMTYTHTQTPASASGKMNNLFYVYENAALTAGNRVLLEINAT